MRADPRRTSMWSRLGGRGSVKVRITLGAVLVVGLVLSLAAVVLTSLLRSSLTEHVRSAAHARAGAIADQIAGGMAIDRIGISGSDDEFVQILRDGEVVVASEIIEGKPAVAEVEPGRSVTLHSAWDDDPYLVVAATAESDRGPMAVLVGQTLDQVVESTATLTGLLAVGVPVLLLFLGFGAWRVVGNALGPVESIRSEVQAISSEQLHRRVPVPDAEDEIARLAATMNEMLERLDESQQRQRRFVADASHELRSPVATILQHAEVALTHPETTEARELAGLVLSEGERVQQLVEDLLLLARLEEGVKATKASVDLDDLVFEAATRSRARTDKEIDVSRVSGGRVLGDRHRLTRVVNNLLDNAIRHATSRIALALTEDGDEAVLLVDDDGPGIPGEERDRVFERFVRLDAARDRDSGGAGLGLAIVAEVVTSHAGSVRVSDSPLGGARLEVRIPTAG